MAIVAKSMARSRILEGAREALAYAKGEAETTEYGVHIPAEVDVRAIRQKLGSSQKENRHGTRR